MYCLDFFLWLKTLPQCFVFDTMCINCSTNQTCFMLQTMLSKLLLNKKWYATMHCHNTTKTCSFDVLQNLVLCCTTNLSQNLYMLSYTVQKTSPKMLYAVCSNLHHNNHKIAPKWQKKVVWKKYQSSRKKQFKITYCVSFLNLSRGSTKGIVS